MNYLRHSRSDARRSRYGAGCTRDSRHVHDDLSSFKAAIAAVQHKPTAWVAVCSTLSDADASAAKFMEQHGIPRRDAEQLFGLDELTNVRSKLLFTLNVLHPLPRESV